MCLQALKLSQNILKQTFTNKNEPIDDNFKQTINDYLKETPQNFKIDCEMAQKAIELIKYFTFQKKILAGYPPNHDLSQPPNKQKQLMRKILLFKGECVTANAINRNFGKKGQRAHEIKEAMIELQVRNLGSVKEERNSVTKFIKQKYEDIADSMKHSFETQLSKLDISVPEFKSSYANSAYKSHKRKNSECDIESRSMVKKKLRE